MNRNTMLQQLEQATEWDMVIIGGGATGLGAALDATTRGYKTLLIEAFDFGKGTSGRSTKLVHGGVRYLAQGNIKLVMEALKERAYLLKNAPHVTTASPFIVPVYSWYHKFLYGIGLKMYDILAAKLSLGKTRWLGKKTTLAHLPGINPKHLKGGILYYDGQFDDARLAIDLAATAIKHGATIINYCKAISLLKTNGKISGVTAEDTIAQKKYTIKAKIVINATGVFADDILQMDEAANDKLVAPSQGIHLVVEKAFFPGTNALMIPKTTDGRVLFAVPWHDKVVIGTTDTPISKVSFEPIPLEEEIAFVLHNANMYLHRQVNRTDVLSSFAGLRPLVKQKGAQNTALLSRDHTILVSKSNLVTITGGKWTTYRKMAEDVVNNAAFAAKLPKKECVTKHLAIDNTQQQGSGESFLRTPFNITETAIIYFVQHEMAITVEDVLSRRIRLLLLDAKAAIAAAPEVAGIMADVLGKDETWVQEQVESFTRLANNYILQ